MEAENSSLVAVGGGALAKPDFPARASPSFFKLFWVVLIALETSWRLLEVFRQKKKEEKVSFGAKPWVSGWLWFQRKLGGGFMVEVGDDRWKKVSREECVFSVIVKVVQ